MKTSLLDERLLVLLRSLVDSNGDPFRIGDAQAPFPPDGQETPITPYVVLYPWAHGDPEEGHLGDPHSRRWLNYRVLSVSWSKQTAVEMSDIIRNAILGRNAADYLNSLDVTGYAVTRRRLVSRGPARLEGTLWNVDEEFTFHCAPTL